MVCMVVSSFWLLSDSHSEDTSPGALRILGATLTFQGVVVVMLYFFARKHGMNLKEAFGFNLHPGRAVVLGVTVALLFVPIAFGLQIIVSKLAGILHIHLPEQNAINLLKLANSWPDRAAFGFMAILAAPLAEEGLFRGVFYPAIKRLGFPNAALWSTSLFFALIHGNVMIFLPLVVLAILLVKLYEYTGNLLACIICHATFNAFNFLMLFAGEDLINFIKHLSQPAS